MRHREKVSMRSLILRAGPAVHWETIGTKVEAVRTGIAREVANYAEETEVLYNARKPKIKRG
jgi:hypothetical protein